MPAQALQTTFADLTGALVGLTYSPNEQLADQWRGSHAEVSDHLEFINQHARTIADGRSRPAYLAQCRKQLAYRLPRYLDAVRLVTVAEMEMRARNMPFAVDGDAWEA